MICKSKQIKANQSKSKQIKLNHTKPYIMSRLPKPIVGNNQYPGELIQVEDKDGNKFFVPPSHVYDFKVIDVCIVIDTVLGIFARERAVDTIFLERDHTRSGLVFREY